MTTLTNSFEGGTNSTSITTGNSGGASGNAFDSVNIGAGATNAYDNTHAAHGSLACELATGSSASAYLQWSTSMGSQAQVWFRQYLYVTANPGATIAIWRALQTSTLCGGFTLQTDGKIRGVDQANTTVFITTNPVPLNQWFRIEGFLVGNASTGQIELKLFATADAQVPVETKTSAASLNTLGSPDTYRFGIASSAASIGPFWMDDLGLSSTGYLGPVSFPGPASLGKPVRTRVPQVAPRGRVTSNRGAGVRNPTSGPVFRQAVQPVRARIPQIAPRGRVTSNLGAAVRNPTPAPGPVFRQAVQPARAPIPRPRAGGLVTANQHTPPYVPPVPPPPPAVAPALDASPLPSLITTFPGTT